MRKRMIMGLAGLGMLAALAGEPGLAQDKKADDMASSEKMAGDKMAKKKSKKHGKHKMNKMDKRDKMEKKGDGKM